MYMQQPSVILCIQSFYVSYSIYYCILYHLLYHSLLYIIPCSAHHTYSSSHTTILTIYPSVLLWWWGLHHSVHQTERCQELIHTATPLLPICVGYKIQTYKIQIVLCKSVSIRLLQATSTHACFYTPKYTPKHTPKYTPMYSTISRQEA